MDANVKELKRYVEENSERLALLPPEELKEFLRDAKDYLDYKATHKIEDYKPYEWQRQFMEAGAIYDSRFLSAGNRCGKTHTAGVEMAYHLTGRYPENWKGRRINSANNIFWAVGITLQSVCDVVQKELLGTNDFRNDQELGTGSIPKECIELKTGLIPDGGKVKQILIKHSSGRFNTLRFFGSENVAVMMGQKCAGIWIDEQALNSMEVYTQCVTRTINALGKGKHGFVMITATPEKGLMPLNRHFIEGSERGDVWLQYAAWDDCEHMTEDEIEKMLKRFPKYQHDMRRKGLPFLGSDAVFPIDPERIKVSEITPLPHWRVVSAMDDGTVVDPAVICTAFHDPDNDKYYLAHEIYIDGDVLDKSPKRLAEEVLASRFSGVPLIVPHDMGSPDNHNVMGRAKLMQEAGVNVESVVFRNPNDVEFEIQHVSRTTRSNRAVEPGLMVMRQLMEDEKLKVSIRCSNWFREKEEYYYYTNPNTGESKRKGAHHTIDASRYAIMSLLAGKGCLYSQVTDRDYSNLQSFTAYTINL